MSREGESRVMVKEAQRTYRASDILATGPWPRDVGVRTACLPDRTFQRSRALPQFGT